MGQIKYAMRKHDRYGQDSSQKRAVAGQSLLPRSFCARLLTLTVAADPGVLVWRYQASKSPAVEKAETQKPSVSRMSFLWLLNFVLTPQSVAGSL